MCIASLGVCIYEISIKKMFSPTGIEPASPLVETSAGSGVLYSLATKSFKVQQCPMSPSHAFLSKVYIYLVSYPKHKESNY